MPTLVLAQSAGPAGSLNVLDYGAVGDGVSDNTEAFQKALDAAAHEGAGGTLFVPAGEYLFKGHLTIPDNVTLEGIWNAPALSDKFWYPDRSEELLAGSVLMPTEGEGQEEGPPFIALGFNTCLKGVSIYYPNQIKANPPKAYPWTVGTKPGGAFHCSIIDVLMINPYQAVDFGSGQSGRHFIRNLYAHPLYRGIFIDKCYDVGRIENVHLWPFWGYTGEEDPLGRFISEKAIAFVIGRTDWQYISNCFSIFYHTGFHFIHTADGPPNVLLTQSGADCSVNAVVCENTMEHAGVSFTNSQLFGRILVKDSNSGPLRFTSCGFFGATREDDFSGRGGLADISGKGHVSFENCHFITLDARNTAESNIIARGGGLSISNCLFMDYGRTHVHLKPEVKTAVITSNTFKDIMRIENEMNGQSQIALNVESRQREEEEAIVIDNKSEFFHTEGEWLVGRGGEDYLGDVHWAYDGDGSRKAFWRPELPAPGQYEVYIWYCGDPHSSHATDAPFYVHHAQGMEEFRINLRKQTGRWVKLGSFPFKQGRESYVMTTNEADAHVIADAVKFVPEKKPSSRRKTSSRMHW